MLIHNHTDANKGKIKGSLYLEDIFGSCKTFKRLTKNLGFQLTLKTNDWQDILYTSMADDIIVTIINLYLVVPNLIPSVETQLMFDEATQKNHEISFDEYYTEGRVIKNMIAQHDIGSAQQINAPKQLNCAHQTKERIDTANKKKNNTIFDNLNLRRYFVEIDSIQYPWVNLLIDYVEKDYTEQYKNLQNVF